VSSGASQPTLLGPVGASGVLGIFEVVPDLVKAFLSDRILTFGAQVPAIYDGINKLVRMRTQFSSARDLADTLET